MQDERSDEHGLADFAAQLAALVPRAEINRDQLMFDAGARTARRKLQVVNRLLGAVCVLLAVTTIAPLAMPRRPSMVADQAPTPAFKATAAASSDAVKVLPNQLIAADSRELAAAIAEGRGDLRPARLREQVMPSSGPLGESGASPEPKPSRELLREYLQAGGERL